MGKLIRDQDALDYHSQGRPGKIEVIPTKRTKSSRDLALAYSPGVAIPCLEIEKNPIDAYKYTAKGNLVGVISNGTAVLGLGHIGPLAAKPVMEGKGLLFKIFSDIDVFDIEINKNSVDEFVEVVKALEPTFGGINLEDIKAPECFEIEARLKKELNIPVMHDDQHGTAIITSAAMLNAVELAGKKPEKLKVVVSGAGAAAISCAKLFCSLGVKSSNVIMVDSKGVIHKNRDDLNQYKMIFATGKPVHTLEEAIKGSDLFMGLSIADILTPKMLKSMAKRPIVFALANPNPEIDYNLAKKTRKDVIMATGRSDFPNQVNNVLGFPFIFRGALDVQATEINEEMKLAAVKAIAGLTREPVPDLVNIAYNSTNLSFGNDYIIPKALDPRLLTTVAPAVAKAAIDSGVAQKQINDWDQYKAQLRERLGAHDQIIRVIIERAKNNPKRVVFSEAENFKILKAAQIVKDDGIAIPILLGDKTKIQQIIDEYKLDLEGVDIIDPTSSSTEAKRKIFSQRLFEQRCRRGFNKYEAEKIMRDRHYFSTMLLETGEADALISGLTRKYPETIKPALEIIGTERPDTRVVGMYIMLTKKGPFFFADTTMNVQPSAEELVEIAVLMAEKIKQFNIKPNIAFLSYSNFGSAEGEEPRRIRKAVQIMHKEHPEITAEGEMQANLAFDRELLKDNYPFCDLISAETNALVFPNLSAGNIAYKLMQVMGSAEAVGPILLGMKKAVHILQLGSSVQEIVNMVAIAVVDAQDKEAKL